MLVRPLWDCSLSQGKQCKKKILPSKKTYLSEKELKVRNKKKIINQYITSLDVGSNIDEDWQKFVNKQKIEELEQIIKDENLNRDAAYTFVNNAFSDGHISTGGPAIKTVLPPVSRFSKTGERTQNRESVLRRLTQFFERFFDISNGALSWIQITKVSHRTAREVLLQTQHCVSPHILGILHIFGLGFRWIMFFILQKILYKKKYTEKYINWLLHKK